MSTVDEIELLRRYARGKGINIGCGHAPIPEAWNIDIDPNAEAEIYADAESLPFYAQTFDYVVSAHCLEHVTAAPMIVLREWLRVLKVGGTLAFIVPDGTQGSIAMGSTPGSLVEGRHVHCFTVHSMTAMLEYLGCRLLRCTTLERPEWKTRTLLFAVMKTSPTPMIINPNGLKARYAWGKSAFLTTRFHKRILFKIRKLIKKCY